MPICTLVSRYVMLCFSMVFLAFVEFAFISFIGIFVKRLKLNDLVRVTTLRQMTRWTSILILNPKTFTNPCFYTL